ncbi:MarR family winged helix-turn-helix transcriptional regulator [Hyphococcus luteus]|uniref:MarR family transcriptional regulator n=1 Tax=Hyphococcus luteus TaxID=2058213 RepID=A0A2S7K8T2_9PROT|nr:MarR family transcriptional regulator [Marinicaulis flavus]PQA88891.1 MarR family transcriptional regulator [Marinicaulis flavus]
MTSRLDQALISLRQILRATEISSRALAKQCGLTPSQLILMEILAKSGAAAPSALAKDVSLSQATVTALIDKLENRNLVERKSDEKDRRRVSVVLTSKGAATLENAPSLLQQRFERGFGKLEDWEQAFLVAALERTVALLDAEELDAAPVLDVGAINDPAK